MQRYPSVVQEVTKPAERNKINQQEQKHILFSAYKRQQIITFGCIEQGCGFN